MGNTASGEEKKAKKRNLVAASPNSETARCTYDASEAETARALSCTCQGQPHDLLRAGPPLAPNDDARGATIRALRLFDNNDGNQELDNILDVVRNIFSVAYAAISMFDGSRVLITNVAGAGAEPGPGSWQCATCPWTFLQPTPVPLVVEDLLDDARFSETVWAKTYGIRFYASAPLVASNGHRLGTLCVGDTGRRTFDAQQCRIFNNFAELVVREVEKHAALAKLLKENDTAAAMAYKKLLRTLDCFDSPLALINADKEGWAVSYASPAWATSLGMSRESVADSTLAAVFEAPGARDAFWQGIEVLRNSGRAFMLKEMKVKAECGSSVAGEQFNLSFRPAARDYLDEHTLPLGVPSFVSMMSKQQRQDLYFVTLKPIASDDGLQQMEQEQQARGKSRKSLGAKPALKSGDASANQIEGLKLRQLLGRGGHAAVYFGKWYGTDVAVKIIEDVGGESEDWDSALTELKVGKDINHPMVVRTMAYHVIKEDAGEDEAAAGAFDLSAFRDELLTTGSGSWPVASLSAGGGPPTLTSGTSIQHSVATQSDSGSYQSNGRTFFVVNSADSDAADGSGGPLELDDDQWQPLGSLNPVPGVDYSADIRSLTSASGTAIEHTPNSRAKVEHTPNSRMRRGAKRVRQKILLVMEYCNRGCLQDAIDQGWLRTTRSLATGQPHAQMILATAIEIASAMAYLHQKGVVHADLTAFNVLLSSTSGQAALAGRGFCAKVADFGCSHTLDAVELLRINAYGTVTHMPPELLANSVLSKSADVYAFGVLLWQMWTGSRPWAGMRHVQIMHTVVKEKGRLQFPQGTPPAYEKLATACMDYEPDRRPTFETICKELQDISDALESDAVGSF